MSAAVLAVLLSGCSTPKPTMPAQDERPEVSDTVETNAMKEENDVMDIAKSAGSAMDQGQEKPEPSAMEKSPYADGTYAATGNYQSPGGAEQIDVSLVIKNGLVTDVTYVGHASMGKSQMFQQKFGQALSQAVVGKSIDTLALGVLNGASLTPKGFNDAVMKIKVEARI
jgi:uncharacterized protein with FMN-binding domain